MDGGVGVIVYDGVTSASGMVGVSLGGMLNIRNSKLGP